MCDRINNRLVCIKHHAHKLILMFLGLQVEDGRTTRAFSRNDGRAGDVVVEKFLVDSVKPASPCSSPALGSAVLSLPDGKRAVHMGHQGPSSPGESYTCVAFHQGLASLLCPSDAAGTVLPFVNSAASSGRKMLTSETY